MKMSLLEQLLLQNLLSSFFNMILDWSFIFMAPPLSLSQTHTHARTQILLCAVHNVWSLSLGLTIQSHSLEISIWSLRL